MIMPIQPSPTELSAIPFLTADGRETTLGAFRGQVLLVVNVASRCGLTPQYDVLGKVHESYRERGFSVLGFPANEFGSQEPGTDAEIQEFCRLNYGVTFPVFAKIAVKGPGIHPLYRRLTTAVRKAWPKPGGTLKQRVGRSKLARDLLSHLLTDEFIAARRVAMS